MAKRIDKSDNIISDKLSALEAVQNDLTKKYGPQTLEKLNNFTRVQNIDFIPSGSLGLDSVIGIGGIPRGRIVEIYGPESGGKTSLALHIVAQAQAYGGIAAFIDMEHSINKEWAMRIGVNMDELYVAQPEYGEQALDIVEAVITSGAVDVVVLDSVAALVSRHEIEGEMGDSHVALQARLMTQALRRINAAISKTNTSLIFINQLRDNIGAMGYGPKESTPGGRALKFYASVRLDVRRIETIKANNEAIGNKVKVRVTKNKVGSPYGEAEFDIIFKGTGISRTGEIIDIGTELGIIDKKGAFYRYNNGLIGQGREAARRYLIENIGLALELETLIRKQKDLPVDKLYFSRPDFYQEPQSQEIVETELVDIE